MLVEKIAFCYPVMTIFIPQVISAQINHTPRIVKPAQHTKVKLFKLNSSLFSGRSENQCNKIATTQPLNLWCPVTYVNPQQTWLRPSVAAPFTTD